MTPNHQPLPAHDAQALLDSLAMGLTPPQFASLTHVSRKDELIRLDSGLQRLKHGASTFTILTAHNGAGKTHLLDITEQAALNQGLAVPRIEFRPEYRLRGNDRDSRAFIGPTSLVLRSKERHLVPVWNQFLPLCGTASLTGA